MSLSRVSNGPITTSGRFACVVEEQALSLAIDSQTGATPVADDVLGRLAALISSRRQALADTSYSRQLLDAGAQKCARKLGEEAIETVIAGISGDENEVRSEAADLLYHLLVLLEVRGVPLADVLATLEGRMAQSGLAEKAGRVPG